MSGQYITGPHARCMVEEYYQYIMESVSKDYKSQDSGSQDDQSSVNSLQVDPLPDTGTSINGL